MSYHYVRDTRHSRLNRLNALSPVAFASQVDSLANVGQILDAAALLSVLEGTRQTKAASVVLTFDDGLIDHYTTILPILRAQGVHGTFFVSAGSNTSKPRHVLNVQKVQLLLATMGGDMLLRESERLAARAGFASPSEPMHPVVYRYDPPADRRVKQLLNYELPYEVADILLATLFERYVGSEEEIAPTLYLAEDMIREMSSAGMTFGLHTSRHRVLSRLSVDLQRAEIEDGMDWIRGLTGQSTVPFSYPHGHAHAYTDQTIDLVRRAGYSMAFTAVRAFAQPTSRSRFELPRFDTRDVEHALGVQHSASLVDQRASASFMGL